MKKNVLILLCFILFVGSPEILRAQPSATISTSLRTLCNSNTGSATVSVSGGLAPYTYIWNTSPPQTTATATNLSAGNYRCIVTDSLGNQDTAFVNIGIIGGMLPSVATTFTTCLGNDGSATISAPGSLGTLYYTWSPPVSSSNTATALSAGSYTVTVKDSLSTGIANDTLFIDDFDGALLWTLNTPIGLQDVDANQWEISDDESWDGVCGSGNLVTPGDRTMYIHCTTICLGTGALYDAGGGILSNTTTDKFSHEIIDINTIGYTNIGLRFSWRCMGQTGQDYGTVRYSTDGGLTWVDLPTQYQNSSSWTCAYLTLPTVCEGIPFANCLSLEKR